MFWSFVISLLLIIETSSLVDNNGENKPIVEAQNVHVTVTSGQKAILTCIFSGVNHELSLSSSHQLIWIRQSYEAQNADSILAHNQDLLISDPRLTIQRTDFDYSLTITNVNIDDEGIYACEVNTQPPQKALVHLYVRDNNSLSSCFYGYKLIKNQQLSKATTEQAAPKSYLRSIPILNRLRVRPSDHTTAASSSSCTSSSQSDLIASTSKNKQIARLGPPKCHTHTTLRETNAMFGFRFLWATPWCDRVRGDIVVL
ncbi:unnamed protein product [Rotaria magnacalcarata]|uniref:Ig-like domain-containing protein n=1 Tax=Rotaria magnacalcarata TaxID=392030 RepID=A0A819RDN6_9BILA|nr:unnamed protein product [Rotaria magnacalcarata]